MLAGLKAVGAALVVLSGTGLAWLVADAHGRRPRELAALRSALQVLLTEIDYGLTPLPAALRRAAVAVDGPVAGLLRDAARRLELRRGATAGEALREALTGADLCLTAGDREVLLALSGALGASDRHDQARHINLALRRLEAAEEEARRDGERRRRLAWSLGVLGSLAVVLIAV